MGHEPHDRQYLQELRLDGFEETTIRPTLDGHMMLTGRTGMGKTTAAKAMARDLLESDPTADVRYIDCLIDRDNLDALLGDLADDVDARLETVDRLRQMRCAAPRIHVIVDHVDWLYGDRNMDRLAHITRMGRKANVVVAVVCPPSGTALFRHIRGSGVTMTPVYVAGYNRFVYEQ